MSVFLSLSVAFADAAVAPIDFPIAPAFAVPKVSMSSLEDGGDIGNIGYLKLLDPNTEDLDPKPQFRNVNY